MGRDHHSTLLLFRAGGARFAVEAATVQRIAAREWRPDPADGDQPAGRLVDLAAELGLAAAGSERTLVVEAQGLAWGFQVDSIDSEVLGDFEVHALPEMLAGWMEPVIIRGVADSAEGDALIHVLDLRLLARHLPAGGGEARKGMPA